MNGFSLWVVPHGYNIMMSTYKMEHIPHVTLVQNLPYPWPRDVGRECTITTNGDMDTLCGTDNMGVYCTVDDVPITRSVPPHMVIWYQGNPGVSPVPPLAHTIIGILCVADCRHRHPSYWEIVI